MYFRRHCNIVAPKTSSIMKSHSKAKFLEAYEQYADAIFRHCYFRVFNRERAKEIMQETFMKTWEVIAGGEKIRNLRAFLYRVVNNLIIDEARKRKELSLDKLEQEGFDAPALTIQADHLENLIEIKALSQILNKLDSKDREVIVLRYLDDLSIKEAAQILGESENNVSVRLHRALGKARKILNETSEYER